MEAQTILYFRPAEEQMHKNTAAKRHWWENASLAGKVLPAETTGGLFVPVDCQVPAFYYKKKPWPGEVLLQAMETARNGAPGLADAYLPGMGIISPIFHRHFRIAPLKMLP